jgi:hypothetical protein
MYTKYGVRSNMQPMVRKQVYIKPEQEALIKRRSKELGVTEAEIIRRGIDLAAHGSQVWFPDKSAWEEAKVVIEERMRMKVPQTGRGWTRDELYDERLGRFSR